MNRVEIFTEQLDKIHDKSLNQFIREAIQIFPDYFFEIPASITEKHHPLWDNGPGGLVRHTIAVADYCDMLSDTFGLDYMQRQICIASGILHDSIKYGIKFDLETKDAYYKIHATLVTGYFSSLRKRLNLDLKLYNEVMYVTERHMGPYAGDCWDKPSGVNMENRMDAVVHLADFIVSRDDFIHAKFKEFHVEADEQPDVPWLETKDMWWRRTVQENKYYVRETSNSDSTDNSVDPDSADVPKEVV